MPTWPALGVILACLVNPTTYAANSRVSHESVGPATAEGAQVLLSEAAADIDAQRYDDGVRKLERLIHRYPAHPRRAEALRWKGEALYHLGRWAEAAKSFRAAIDSAGTVVERAHSRADLVQALLKLKKNEEAFLLCAEMIRALAVKSGAPETSQHQVMRWWGLVLKARSEVALKQQKAALRTLESFDAEYEKAKPKPAPIEADHLRGYAAFAWVEWKVRECETLPSPGKLGEGQIRDQMSRRATCLQEALLPFRGALELAEFEVAQEAEQILRDAYARHEALCQKPPQSPAGLSPIERKRFQEELAAVLKRDFAVQSKTAVELLKSWKPSLQRPEMTFHLNRLTTSVERIATRSSAE